MADRTGIEWTDATDTQHPRLDGELYIALLLERQATWMAEHGVHPYGLPPLLEWFVRPGDEDMVDLPEQRPEGLDRSEKPKRAPRVYRPAASIRDELASVEAEMERVAGRGPDDVAATNLSPRSRSRAARTAGRRRFAQLDRDLERYTALKVRRDRLAGRLAAAEAREEQAVSG